MREVRSVDEAEEEEDLVLDYSSHFPQYCKMMLYWSTENNPNNK